MTAAKKRIDLNLEPWLAINDEVMGGISQGEMTSIENGLRFQGSLSLENNGGFSSVHRMLSSSPGQFCHIRLQVLGDGRTYQFRLKTDESDDIRWRAIFGTNGSNQQVNLKISDFEPVFRGRVITGHGPLDPDKIAQLGFLIADKRAGAFELDVLGIEFL